MEMAQASRIADRLWIFSNNLCGEQLPVPLACASPPYGNKTGHGVNPLVNEREPNFFQKDFLYAECPAHR